MARKALETKRLATKLMADNESSPLALYRRASSSSSSFRSGMTSTTDVQHGPRMMGSNDDDQQCDDQSIRNIPTVASSLPHKLVGDAAVGTGVTFLMAPFLSVVDKAISQRATGSHTLMSSCLHSIRSMASNPITFARNPVFLWCWTVYAATYTAANSLKTIAEHRKEFSGNNALAAGGADKESMGKLGIFFGTSFANSGASVMKDRAFAYMFAADSAAAAVQKVPVATYGLWLSRDLIGVGSSFVLPDLIAQKVSNTCNPEEVKRNRDLSQFLVPVATQFVAGPLHLLGLDLFNRPMQGMSWRDVFVERGRFLVDGYSAVVGARIARIIPGYGFGGVLNTKFRDSWREYLLEKETFEGTTSGKRLEQGEWSAPLSSVIRTVQKGFYETA